jgi:tuftelin-interacting protein 11
VRRVEVNPADQRLDVLDTALAWANVLPRHHMSCLVRAELLPTWHAVLLGWLKRSDAAANADLVAWYRGWKAFLAERLGGLDGALRAELGFGLDLMAAARRLPRASLDAALDAHQRAGRPSFLTLLKAAYEAADAPATSARPEVASRPASLPSSSSSSMASFKEVVAAFAEAEGVVFALKATRSSDGRPLYAFGPLTVLLDHDVAHIEEPKGRWQPVSLEELRGRIR